MTPIFTLVPAFRPRLLRTAGPPPPTADDQRPELQRRSALYLERPDECPELVGVLPHLIHPPGKLSATASWIRFRDKTLLPLIQDRQDDPNLPNFLKQAEAVLAWRASIDPGYQSWSPDPAA